MNSRSSLSTRTRMNWLINASVFLGGVVAAISGIYFLFLTSGGYQGGRNIWYGVKILFERSTWGDLHTWGSVIMIIVITIHVAIHWDWIKMMAKRVVKYMSADGFHMSKGAMVNLVITSLFAISFLITSLSGIYFLFTPTGGFEGGSNLGWDPGFLWSRSTWDLIHTWSGVVSIIAAVLHFVIHWGWVKKVTVRFFQFRKMPPKAQSVSETS